MACGRLALATLILLAWACELGTTGPGSDEVSISTREGCAAPLSAGAAAGQPCAVSGDCAEVCCTCSSVTRSFAARVCINGVCQSASSGCAKAEVNASERCQ